MPWAFIAVVGAAMALTKFVLFPWMQKHGGQKVNVVGLAPGNVVNDQVSHFPSFVGPTSIYVLPPSGMLVESITVDGAALDVGAAQEASLAASMPGGYMKIDVTRPSGKIVIVSDSPTILGRLELKFLGPESAAQLEAQGLLKRRLNTINYGAGA